MPRQKLQKHLPHASEVIAKLEDEHCESLHEDFESARNEQRERLKDAIDDSLRHVPALLRRPIKKILG